MAVWKNLNESAKVGNTFTTLLLLPLPFSTNRYFTWQWNVALLYLRIK
jgi:hypothetical protein